MIQTILCTLKLSHTYSFNTFIHRLRKLPLIKRLVPESLYGQSGLKSFFNILILIKDIITLFLFKFLYIGLMIFMPVYFFYDNRSTVFIHLVFCFTLVGALVNAEILSATKEKYYAFALMRVDAKRLALANFIIYIIGQFISFIPAALVFGTLCSVPFYLSLCLPLCVAAGKITFAGLILKLYEKTGLLLSEKNWKFIFSLLILTAAAGYGLPLTDIIIPEAAMPAMTVLFIAAAPFSFVYLKKSKTYHRLYKQILTADTIIFNVQANAVKNQQNTYLSNLSDEKIFSSREGYEYFNDIFVKRHKKLLTTSAKRLTVILLVITAVSVFLALVSPEARKVFNSFTMTLLPYFVFIMYLISRGGVVTQAMFFNCDHSMLAYRFYRQPESVLAVFKARLKTLIKINLVPALVIAAALPFLLFLSGGTDLYINYLLLPVSIIFMSVFFSVHYLVIYYLLQPYDIRMESKSHGYSIVCALTYIVCWFFIRLEAPTFIFAICIIIFTLVYIILSLALVYKYAPKTFRLK